MPPAEEQRTVPGYIDCGLDSVGNQTVVCVGAVAQIDVHAAKFVDHAPHGETQETRPVELVTLYYMHGETRELGPEHSKVFLLKIGLRQPETTNLVLPQTANPFDRH